jgi:tetratricopeptide (TPR) repeat protein
MPSSTVTKPATEKKSAYRAAFWITATAILGLLFWAYWTHFDNPFEFDDEHTIVHNSAIDTLDVGRFMTDATAFSALPANQAWRPGVTILNSIDTIRSENRVPDPQKFHTHIFASYILLGILLFFMFRFLLRSVFPQWKWTNLAALLGTGLFMLHTANAETINYIIARSDSQSTLFIIAGMLMFMYSEICRRYFLYVIPMAIGFLIKETAIMLAPLLVVYCWLFTPSFRKHVPGLVLTFFVAGMLYFISTQMTLDTWTSGGGNWFLYLCTQAFVIVHYCFTFVLPIELSADTDWTYVSSAFDTRVLTGAVFIAALIWLAIRWSKKPETRIASFGIFWFFIALAPTSSVFPFAEVMNDHRIFFPFIGLVMVVMNFAVLLFIRFEKQQLKAPRYALLLATAALLIAHTAGTRERCAVWGSGESLWKDVTIKSPKNGRGLMNYALAIKYRNLDSAIILFEQVRDMMPGYSYVYINLGVAYNERGVPAEAEKNYRMALNLDTLNPEAYYYYGDWLIAQGRTQEGVAWLERGLAKSPGHSGINQLLAIWRERQFQSPLEYALQTADQNPTPENLLALSLAWYNAGEYLQCALAAEKAVAIKPDYAPGWNNICAGYNKTGDFDKAIAAGQKAVQLSPDDELSKNNLAFAQREKARFDQLIADANRKPTSDKWITLSLEWYMAGNFRKSLEAAEAAAKMNPGDATAWNNICAAANKTGEFDRAIEAGEKAVQLKPEWELAKNNLAEAQRLKAKLP